MPLITLPLAVRPAMKPPAVVRPLSPRRQAIDNAALVRDLPMRRPLDSFAQGRPLGRALVESAATLALLFAVAGALLVVRLYLGLG